MSDIFNDPLLSYKNFKMGTEIDISGTFIYNGIKELEQMDSFRNESEVFSFLYHIAVGIERLQKVLIVMLEDIDQNNMHSFEESLITHSHQELHNRIKLKCSISFNSRENSFLQVLSEFYKKGRYDRFNISGRYGAEIIIIENYIKNNLESTDYEIDVFSNHIVNSNKIKELFGRVIGSISKKYYNEIWNQSTTQKIYTYELRHESKAAKIFLPEFEKNSLHKQTINEKIALKEFIVFLINTKQNNSFRRFLKEIEPLDFEIALANEYLESLCKGIVPQELIDTVEYLYEEHPYTAERIKMIDLIGNTRIIFEFSEVYKCNDTLKSLLSGGYDYYDFALNFPKDIEELEYDEAYEILKEIPEICRHYLSQFEIGIDEKDKFITKIKEIYDKYIDFFNLD